MKVSFKIVHSFFYRKLYENFNCRVSVVTCVYNNYSGLFFKENKILVLLCYEKLAFIFNYTLHLGYTDYLPNLDCQI